MTKFTYINVYVFEKQQYTLCAYEQRKMEIVHQEIVGFIMWFPKLLSFCTTEKLGQGGWVSPSL